MIPLLGIANQKKPIQMDQEINKIPEQSYLQVFCRFLKFGLLAWGGPVAQIAMIRDELVETEKWVSGTYFNRLLAVYQVLPGPETHEICVYLGMLAKGRIGGFLAGLGFMLPGFILMLILSWLYVAFNITHSAFAGVFLGIAPAVIALITIAIYRIGTHVIINKWLLGITILSAIASFLEIPFWITLPVAGLLYFLYQKKRIAMGSFIAFVFLIGVGLNTYIRYENKKKETVISVNHVIPKKDNIPLLTLFVSGLKSGMLTFGGAYTVIAFLQEDAVNKGAWMTNNEFLDGLALSGVLPAPLIIFSTFVGYLGSGFIGALVITFAIFLPAFCFSLFLHKYLVKIVENKPLFSFLEGVAAGVIGLIVVTAIELARSTIKQTPSVWMATVIFILSLLALYYWKNKWVVPVVVFVSGIIGIIFFGNS